MSLGILPLSSFPSLGAPGMAASSSETPLSQTQSKVGDIIDAISAATGSPGLLMNHVNQAVGAKAGGLGLSWARVATFVLGFVLIMAGIFTHPAVREKIVLAGKAAGKAAALAA